MKRLSRISLAVVSACLLATLSAWGQQAPFVYVATGGPQIYAVSPNGDASGLIPVGSLNSAATYESLAVGPDNRKGNASKSGFFLYACDPVGGSIVRLRLNAGSANAAATAVDTVSAAAGGPAAPMCGRVDSLGDLYVSSGAAGAGVYVFRGASSTEIGGNFGSPVSVYGSDSALGGSFAGGGLAQKNVGDLLIVDNAASRIWRAAFTGSTTLGVTSPFAPVLQSYVASSASVSSPVGIARISTGDFFVANQGALDNVVKFTPSNLANPSVCMTVGNGNVTPVSVTTSEDSYVYVGINSPSQNKQVVDVLRGADCSLAYAIPMSNAGPPLGIAVPPVPASPNSTVVGADTFGNTVTSYNFGSSLFQGTTNNCTLTVTQQQVPLSYLGLFANSASPPPPTASGMPMGTWTGGTPVAANGEGGFGTLFSAVAVGTGCSVAPNVQTNLLIDEFYDTTSATNPRIIHCTDDSSSCNVADDTGDWPTSGFLPNDQTSGGKVGGWGSQFFLVNGNFDSNNLGTFCGFQTPLVNGATEQNAPVENAGQGLSVKFKLAAGVGAAANCANGPYITSATALISVAQVLDAGGSSSFVPIAITTQGSSSSNPPIFKFNQNSKNYQFSLSLKGYAPGTYALTITFLSNNASNVTTFFAVQ